MEKYTKAEVGFEHPAKGPHHCSQCEHFRQGTCTIVEGAIAPGDWCRKFDPKEGPPVGLAKLKRD